MAQGNHRLNASRLALGQHGADDRTDIEELDEVDRAVHVFWGIPGKDATRDAARMPGPERHDPRGSLCTVTNWRDVDKERLLSRNIDEDWLCMDGFRNTAQPSRKLENEAPFRANDTHNQNKISDQPQHHAMPVKSTGIIDPLPPLIPTTLVLSPAIPTGHALNPKH